VFREPEVSVCCGSSDIYSELSDFIWRGSWLNFLGSRLACADSIVPPSVLEEQVGVRHL